MTTAEIHEAVASVRSWYHRIEVAPGMVTPGTNDSPGVLARLRLPADMSGQRVLDIGTCDGFFAFECERRGADVRVIDPKPEDGTGFGVAARLLGSRLRYERRSIWDLSPAVDGTFDAVLCLGLLYHLRDPLAALDLIRGLCTGVVYVETAVLHPTAAGDLPHIAAWTKELAPFDRLPLMQFLPGRIAGDDATNFWLPSPACLTAMLEESNFSVTHLEVLGGRAICLARPMLDADLDAVNNVASSVASRRGPIGG